MMKYHSMLLSIVGFFLLACESKTETKVGPSTPDIQQEKSFSTQTLPDTVDTIGNLLWHSNIKTSFALAQKEAKNVIVMVGEESCRWCTKMKKNTLTDPKVQALMEKYILVSIKRSDKEAVKYVPEFDGNIPSFFFMKPNKEITDAIVGYFNADDFSEYIKELEE